MSEGYRAELWARLQDEQPEMVAVMAEVRRVFGRTPTPTIRLGGEKVWSPYIAVKVKQGESRVDWKARQ